MLEVITALAAEEAHSESTPSSAESSPRDDQGTPTQGTAEPQGDEGLLDLYALNREVRRLKKQTISQAKQIHKLKAKLKKLSKGVKPLVKHYILWVQSKKLKKYRGKKQKKKVSSVKLGRNKDEGNLSEEHHDQDDHTAFVYEGFDATEAAVTPDLERKSDETEELERKSDETEELERKSDETEQVIIEEKDTSDVKSGDTEELDLEEIQSTARQSAVTPRTLNFEDEAGPSSPIRPTQEEEPEEQFKDDEFLADILLNRTRGLSIPGPMQSQPQQPTQATDPKEKGKGILVEEPKKKKLTLQQIRALETANDEEVARKVQAEWDAEEERKRLEDLKKPKPKTISKKPTSLAQERNQMMSFLKGQGYKNLQRLRKRKADVTRERCKETLKKEKSYSYRRTAIKEAYIEGRDNYDEFLADILLNRTRGLSIPGPMQSQPQQPTQATDPKEKGKGILVEEPKKKKLTFQQIRALETTHDEEIARKIQAEWDAEEERKRLEDLKKPKSKTIPKKPTSIAQERTQMMSFLKGQGYKNLQRLRYPQMKELYDKVQESIKDSFFKDFIPMGSEKEKQMLQERDAKRLLRKRKATVIEEQPSKKLKLRTETINELKNYLRIVDFEKKLSTPTGLGLILLGDLTTIWETYATSDDDFWKNQEDWEIIRWRLNESSGVHTLELEDGTMLHMLAERRYPLSRELMIRMLDHECLWQVLHPDSLQNVIKSRSNIVECTVTKLLEFINIHQSVLLVFILIYEAFGIGVCCIWYSIRFLRTMLLVNIRSETPKARRSSMLRFVSLP
ncbi:hypothetical protein Tco_0078869 [Tanacetum coccineum]